MRTAHAGGLKPLTARLARDVRARPEGTFSTDIAIGVLSGLIAVGVRYSLPLKPGQLPTLPVVVAVAIVTTFVGVRAGIVTALVGGFPPGTSSSTPILGAWRRRVDPAFWASPRSQRLSS